MTVSDRVLQSTAVLSLKADYNTLGKTTKWQASVTATAVDGDALPLSGATIAGD